MPHPSGPNAYPSGRNAYPSGPDQWAGAATTGSTSASTGGGTGRRVANATTSSASSAASVAARLIATAAATTGSTSSSSADGLDSPRVSTSSASSSTATPRIVALAAAQTSSASSDTATPALRVPAAAGTSSTSSASANGLTSLSLETGSTSSATATTGPVSAVAFATTSSASSNTLTATITAGAHATTTSTSTSTGTGTGGGTAAAGTSSSSTASARASLRVLVAASTGSTSSATAGSTGVITSPLTPVIVDGRARVFCRSDGNGNPYKAALVSEQVYTLFGSSASVQVPAVPVGGGATGTVQTSLILFSAAEPAGRRLVLAHRADLGVIQFRHEYDPAIAGSVPYGDVELLQVTYRADEHLWWRIRHTDTEIVWETSGDNFNWTEQRTIVAPAWASANDIAIRLESWRTDGVNDYAEFDNVNGPISPPPTEPTTPPVFVAPPGPVVPQTPVPVSRLLVADTMTGTIGWELPWSTLSWSNKLNDVGTMSATLVVEAALEAIYSQGARNPADALRETLDGPNRFSYVVAYGNVPVWAGPMQPSVDVPANAPTVSVGGSGIESLIDKRIIMGYTTTATGTWSDVSRDVTFAQTNPAAVVYQLVLNAITSYPDAPYRSLPIMCSSPPATPGDETFTYLSYDLKSTWSAMGDLIGRADGPDVRFVPQLMDTADGVRLSWDLQIGGPLFGGSGPVGTDGSSAPWVFDDATASVARQADAVGTASTYFVSGSGQDREKVIARSTSDKLTRLGFPAMEQVDTSANSETDLSKLQAQADGDIAGHETPSETWTLTAAVDGAPPLGTVLAGDPVTADVRNHWLILPGAYTRRVTEVAGNGSSRYTITAAPDNDVSSLGVTV